MDGNNAPKNRGLRWLHAVLEALDAWAFDGPDTRAMALGLQVRRPARFVRVYRSPAFDAHRLCAACDGEGVTARGHCRECLGVGRVATGRSRTPAGGC